MNSLYFFFVLNETKMHFKNIEKYFSMLITVMLMINNRNAKEYTFFQLNEKKKKKTFEALLIEMSAIHIEIENVKMLHLMIIFLDK